MKNFTNDFPALADRTYLNTASSGLLSRAIVEWRRRHDLNFMLGGSLFRDNQKKQLDTIRNTVARFFGAAAEETALLPNFSFGLNTLLDGLPSNSKILLLENDYPSINWAVEHRGFPVFYAAIDEKLEENIEAAVAAHQPDVFVFSLVQYIDGVLINMDFLRQLKTYHPKLLLIADGTQFLGTATFDFSNSPLDVLGASAYKWLLAGYGNGFFMIKKEARERFFLKTVGFNSAEGFSTAMENIHFMKHLEPGHQDTLNYGTLEQALLMLDAIGTDAIQDRLWQLSKKAKTLFSELGLLDETVLKREQHSNIFNIKGDVALFQKLASEQIICSQRGNGLRLSFHFYNTEEDLERLATVLKKG